MTMPLNSKTIRHKSHSVTPAHPTDYLRQLINVIGAPLIWLLSSLSFFDSRARSPEGLSKINESLIVPLGFAFSIWFPIFIGCIAYGILQAKAPNRSHPLYRDIGWWTGAGFLCICGWSLLSAYAPIDKAQIGTALIFIPAKLCFVKAMLTVSKYNTHLTKTERFLVYGPISLIAGWTSLAVFLNWAPLIMDWTDTYLSPVSSNALVLCAALIWAGIITRMSGGNRAFAFPILWGLVFIAVKQFGLSGNTPLIGGLALIAALILLVMTVYKPKTDLRTST